MDETICRYCGSVLTMTALLRSTEEGYDRACESCVIRERGGLHRLQG